MSTEFGSLMMGVEFEVMIAVRNGQFHRLIALLERKPRFEVRKIVGSFINGATPLLVACREGYLPIVQYLVEKCHADIEQVGQLVFDRDTIDGVSPLWCAAAAGQFHVVRKLISYKADVNCLTKNHSTPLRAACYDGHLRIVEYLVAHGADIEIPNQHGHTCLMIACYKGHLKVVNFLIKHGADIDKQSLKGNTALHDAAESNHVEILSILLKNGAVMKPDASGLTPIICAAHAGNREVVEYLMKTGFCSVQEKVDSLELLGSAYMDQQRDMTTALHFWRIAVQLQSEDPKAVSRPECDHYIHRHLRAVEVSTSSELEELAVCPDALRIHSLLLRERILGRAHPDTVYYIRYRGAAYADMGNFSLCMKLWLYAIDIQQDSLEPCDPMTLSSFMSFIELFNYAIKQESNGISSKPYFHFEDWMGVFRRTVREIVSGAKIINYNDSQKVDLLHRTILISLNILSLFCNSVTSYSKEESLELKKMLKVLLETHACGPKGESILHMICTEGIGDLPQPLTLFPCQKTMEFLLEVGASATAFDSDYNTPLHQAAICHPEPRKLLFQTLLDYGAHLDLRNSEGKTAIEMAEFPEQLGVCTIPYTSLQCLCAQTICRSGMNYRAVLPELLVNFVMHH